MSMQSRLPLLFWLLSREVPTGAAPAARGRSVACIAAYGNKGALVMPRGCARGTRPPCSQRPAARLAHNRCLPANSSTAGCFSE